jgi:hypothetical protein
MNYNHDYARNKWHYETEHTNYGRKYNELQSWLQNTSEIMKLNIPTMITVLWITIMIARHKWHYETEHTN